MSKVFITGITGFLGSNIARYLINNGHTLAATYRERSSKSLCTDFEDQITWILQDEDNWAEKIVAFGPDVIIHGAWLGVGHEDRNVWESQLANIDFIKQILLIAKNSKASKFIALGSQAEYGLFDGCITEDYPLKPTEAYGAVKVICTELIRQFCNAHKIDWFWLRLFSFFGKGESDKWLIPTLVNKLLTTDHMDLTFGEQKYAYLYADDLGCATGKIINGNGESGVYNVSGRNTVSLKTLVTNIRDQINPSFKLNFGRLDYRENQPMHMQGNVAKFIEQFGEFEMSDFNKSLTLTVNLLKKKFERVGE
jgi:nucleoside-diphosphate-sugar epimerase